MLHASYRLQNVSWSFSITVSSKSRQVLCGFYITNPNWNINRTKKPRSNLLDAFEHKTINFALLFMQLACISICRVWNGEILNSYVKTTLTTFYVKFSSFTNRITAASLEVPSVAGTFSFTEFFFCFWKIWPLFY